jgi:pyruvate dehydrogenase (quinone)
MACAYAKFTGRLGVCIATSGPGGVHLLNGLYDAKMDHAPVLAITGLQHSDLIGTFTQQDVSLDKLFMNVAQFNERVMSGAHMERLVDLAIRRAIDRSWCDARSQMLDSTFGTNIFLMIFSSE